MCSSACDDSPSPSYPVGLLSPQGRSLNHPGDCWVLVDTRMSACRRPRRRHLADSFPPSLPESLFSMCMESLVRRERRCGECGTSLSEEDEYWGLEIRAALPRRQVDVGGIVVETEEIDEISDSRVSG